MTTSTCSLVSARFPTPVWASALILAVLVITCAASEPSGLKARADLFPLFDGAIPTGSEVAGEGSLEGDPFPFGEEDEDDREFESYRGALCATGQHGLTTTGEGACFLPGSPLRYAPKQGPPLL